MNLQTAKEIIDLNIKEAGNKMPPDTLEALKLNSEADDFIIRNRGYGAVHIPNLLPSETPE